ncbi:MAG: BrnT family toxin [Polaromonas sp.]
MHIEFDEAKRAKTLQERGLDFADASHVFAGPTLDQQDGRADYGESRTISMGLLDGRVVVLVWTPRGEARRIISMRYANERERKNF